MKTRSFHVESKERSRCTTHGSYGHSRERTPRIAVLAEDVPDAGAVPQAYVRRQSPVRMDDHKARVVLELGSEIDGTDEELGLLAGRPPRPKPKCLVERAQSLEEVAAEENGVRVGAVPDVVACYALAHACPVRGGATD